MQKTHKKWSLILILSLIFSFSHPILAAESLDAHNYAPGLFFQDMVYTGEGNEFAGGHWVLQFETDNQGIYQYSIDNSGTTTAHVMQLTDEGIFELAYFPETYDLEDLRQHADATDQAKSLILPKYLSLGTEFNRGYSQEQRCKVINILDQFEINQVKYYDVLVIETKVQNRITTSYYAPGVGLIYEEFTASGDNFLITQTLTNMQAPSKHLLGILQIRGGDM